MQKILSLIVFVLIAFIIQVQQSLITVNGQTAYNYLQITSLVRHTYYIANEGSDANDGLTQATAWATLNKVNSTVRTAGDSVLFKNGGTFSGQLKLTNSGMDGIPIVYGSYGIGAKPVITGFTAVDAWTNLGSNIWESTSAVSTLPTANVVTINGVNTAKGRYPNKGFNTITAITTTSITDSKLGAINWTGADLVTRKNAWIVDKDKITSQSGSTINFASSKYPPKVNYGYFIQNDARTLDAQNEWYYDPTTKKIKIYSTSTPVNVKVSSIDTIVVSKVKSYITFNNITFQGANTMALYVGNGNKMSIKNCDFALNYNGIVTGNYGVNLYGFKVDGCTFLNTQNNGIVITSDYNNTVITNNSFNKTSMLRGMSGSGDGNSNAISVIGAGMLVQYNTIKNTGYMGINFIGANALIKNNFVDSACLLKEDGGGIYVYKDNSTGKVIENNIVTNVTGNEEGMPANQIPGASAGMGIYSDGWTSNLIVRNNIIGNIGGSAIFINLGTNISITGNTLYNSFRSAIMLRDKAGGGRITGLNIKNNIVVERDLPFTTLSGSKNFNQLALLIAGTVNDIATWGVIDSNYYARPLKDDLLFNIQPNGETFTTRQYSIKTLAGWRAMYRYDMHSVGSPITLSDTSKIRFVYNAKKSPSTQILSGTYIDAKGTTYAGSITLAPYSGAALMQTADPLF